RPRRLAIVAGEHADHTARLLARLYLLSVWQRQAGAGQARAGPRAWMVVAVRSQLASALDDIGIGVDGASEAPLDCAGARREGRGVTAVGRPVPGPSGRALLELAASAIAGGTRPRSRWSLA